MMKSRFFSCFLLQDTLLRRSQQQIIFVFTGSGLSNHVYLQQLGNFLWVSESVKPGPILTQHTNTLQSLMWKLWHPTIVKTSHKYKISHDSSFQLLNQGLHMYKIPGRSYGSDSLPLIFSFRNVAVTNSFQEKKIIFGPLFHG